ncbi:NAD(+) diphosphatase [Desulfopila sp. IMCC35008]|uniref:NAD(+) diphosphatase n=1 Tax=Desulfopila sp. IMCC35008 TaxID=2653858 RepID=UPI0013D1B076|nr:NAD(+) diphosphatase [Desulfopila sp. IMCC35008]
MTPKSSPANDSLFALSKSFVPSPCEIRQGIHSYWFLFSGLDLLLKQTEASFAIPESMTLPVSPDDISDKRCIGTYDDMPCIALSLKQNRIPHGYHSCSLREAHGYLESDLWVIAGRANQILRWKRDNRFCGRCGNSMSEVENEFVLQCTDCSYQVHPRISPAVIMSVIKGNEILLGRSPHFPEGMYSTLAGFVEAGETLEEAVRREVREETGIEITHIRYIASQPWPFPDSLMVGFTAEYAGGEIAVDTRELEDAQWFCPPNMPRLPTRISISRKLIELFLEDHETLT